MKKLLLVALVSILSGCAVYPPDTFVVIPGRVGPSYHPWTGPHDARYNNPWWRQKWHGRYYDHDHHRWHYE